MACGDDDGKEEQLNLSQSPQAALSVSLSELILASDKKISLFFELGAN
jgi:hypothetical protein